jgi:hypothetical protein
MMLESFFHAKELRMRNLMFGFTDQVMAEYIAIMVINNKTPGECEVVA